MEIGIYIHIPFCRSKCLYCDFTSFPNKINKSQEYCQYLLKEIDLYQPILRDYKVKTIFIGGGTPSYIDENLICKILKKFDLKDTEEVSIESNPGTLNKEKLKTYIDSGINRISMGVQSLNPKILREIGRCHSVEDFYKDYDLIRQFNIDNINVDLIIGLPQQTLDDSLFALAKMVDLKIPHISFYSLILEENTKLYDLYYDKKIALPEEDLEREMYHRGVEFLKEKNYIHYEVSNFAREGFQCQHNLFYWKLKPYLGFGISAHSNIGNKRFWNPDNFTHYYKSLDKGQVATIGQELIDKEMEMAEYMILGLRLIEGVNKRGFHKRFNIGLDEKYGVILDKHKENGLLLVEEDNIRFSKSGLDLSNLVLMDILP